MGQLLDVGIEARQRCLNRVDRLAVEGWFAALAADPGRDRVPMHVVPSAIGMKRRGAPSQSAATVYAAHHGSRLVFKSSLHILGSGT